MLKVTSFFTLLSLIMVSCGEEEKKGRVLPIIGERDVVYKMVDGEEIADTVYHKVPEFTYMNQDSITLSSDQLKGKIWVVDFFFTFCPSICPPMTANMKSFSDNIEDLSDQVEIISFSIDPTRDTPSRLREYRESYDITASNWNMLRGNEEATHELAKEFFNGAERNESVGGGFGHTSYFVLVDKEGYARGIYNGVEKEQVELLEADLRKLIEHEYSK